MLECLIGTDNLGFYNRKLARIVGLEGAVYLNELINISTKANNKDKLYDGYFLLDREYIKRQTTIPIEQQLLIDLRLSDIEVIKVREDNNSMLKVDLEMISSMLASEDVALLNKVNKLADKKTKSEKEKAKNDTIAERLKKGIAIPNDELRKAVYEWIDSLFEVGGKGLNSVGVRTFIDTIWNYSRGSLDVAINIINIASVRAYKVAEWAIKVYEDSRPMRTNTIERKENVALSNKEY